MAATNRRRLPFFRNMGDAFFFKRRPKLRMSKEWARPPQEEYIHKLHQEGFLTRQNWQEDDLGEYPLVTQDLADLEEYLLPTFWEFNQKAKYYQNNFYKFQWVFMLGAFLTTVFAVLTGYYGGLTGDEVRFFLITTSKQTMVDIFGFLTAIISAVTSYYTVLSNRHEPRKRWAGYRRLTEELRMMYFKFLSRVAPFDRENRLDMLRKSVLEIRRQEQENG
jgi:hypothetical protein